MDYKCELTLDGVLQESITSYDVTAEEHCHDIRARLSYVSPLEWEYPWAESAKLQNANTDIISEWDESQTLAQFVAAYHRRLTT